MARQRVVRVWCDVCRGSGQRTAATHKGVAVTVGTAPLRLLDLCERHRVELLQPVVSALAKYGTLPEGQPRPRRRRDSNKGRTGPFLCKVAGCKAAPLKHTGTLWQHLRGVHGMGVNVYRQQYGDPVPLTPEEQASLVVEVPCPVTGCGTVYSTALGHRYPQGALASHLRGHHGLKRTKEGMQRVATD